MTIHTASLQHRVLQTVNGREYSVRWSDRPEIIATVIEPKSVNDAVDLLRDIYKEKGIEFNEPKILDQPPFYLNQHKSICQPK